MYKKLLIATLFVVPALHADWIDDLAQFVADGTFDQLKAETTIKNYVEKDAKEIERLEKKAEANDEDGFWATIRGGTYQLQWAAAKASLRYHQKVLDFIKGLPKNERDKDNLIEQLTNLNANRRELEELKADYQNASGWGASIKAGGLVAAKEVQIKARKAYIKSSFIV